MVATVYVASVVAYLFATEGHSPHIAVLYLYPLWFAWIYSCTMEASTLRGTVGKVILGIEVVDNSGATLNFRRASLRFCAKLTSLAIGGMGILMIALNSQHQAMHDRLVRTRVVHKTAMATVEESL